MATLMKQLKTYASSPLYPLHMPGHKRRLSPAPELPCSWDVTEVAGTDDLHEAEGILKDAMDRTAALHGAARSWYLVNGSTCGLLAGIRALTAPGAEILVARNCHKAVYHAIELGNLRAHYLTPPVAEPYSVYGSITPQDVKAALDAHPGVSCVVLTSPTYEGVISDIASICAICHSRGIPVLVDEAHGAHLGLFPGWPDSAVLLGADLVVQSAHKTLPSLTQTAMLHLGKGSLADPEEVERQLDIFETSSPSYPLLASLDGCTEILLQQGKELFDRWLCTLQEVRTQVRPMKHLQVLGQTPLPACFWDFDPGKLPVFCGGTNYTGTSLAEIFRNRFSFETEMACGSIMLAMTSAADDRGALLRFAQALVTVDAEAQSAPFPPATVLPRPGKAVKTIASAVYAPSHDTPLSHAAGQTSGEYVWAYPPGVPLIAPGEQITEDFIRCSEALLASGTALHHSHCKKAGFLRVLLDNPR